MNLQPFKTDGYQIIRGLVDPPVVQQISTFLKQSIEDAKKIILKAGLNVEEQGFQTALAENQPLSQAAHSVLLGHFPLETRLSRVLWEAPRIEAVQRMLKEALSCNRLYMHMPPTARYVLPGNCRAGVPPHQDISYNRHMADFLVMWMPLVPITETCGGVIVYDGSNEPIERNRSEDSSDWLGDIDTSAYTKTICAPMEPGDVLLLNRWIVHGSAPNTSDTTRISVDYRFFGSPQSEKHYLDLQSFEVVEPRAA